MSSSLLARIRMTAFSPSGRHLPLICSFVALSVSIIAFLYVLFTIVRFLRTRHKCDKERVVPLVYEDEDGIASEWSLEQMGGSRSAWTSVAATAIGLSAVVTDEVYQANTFFEPERDVGILWKTIATWVRGEPTHAIRPSY